MNTQQRMAFMMLVFNAIFNSKTNNSDIAQVMINHPNIVNGPAKGRWFKNGLLRGFDIGLNIGPKVISIRCLEQNPNTKSQYAQLARQGSRVMWVIQQTPQGQPDNWLGRMQDSEWFVAEERATTPVVYQASAVNNQATGAVGQMADNIPEPEGFESYEEPLHFDELADLPEQADIPEAVLMAMAEDDDDPTQYE